MKVLVQSGILLVFIFPLSAQQTSQYTMNSYNRYQFNPAYAGFDGSLSITGVYRTQWLGVKRNPVNQGINAHLPFYRLDGAFGIKFENEYLGAEQNTSFAVSYNYVRETPYGLLSAGLSAGFLQKRIDDSILRTPDGIYEGGIIEHQDPAIGNVLQSSMSPNLGIGIYFIHEDFEAGISIDQLITSNLSLSEGSDIRLRSTSYGYFEYKYVYDDIWTFYPSILFKTDFTQLQTELGIRTDYDDYLGGGIYLRGYSGKTIDAIALLGSIQISPKVMIGYSFDIPISQFSTIGDGSHEIIFNYNLGKIIGAGIAPKTIFNPRY